MYNYTHGGDIYSLNQKYKLPFIDFSSNINPMGIDDSIKMAIIESIEDCIRYPDPHCRELTMWVAKHHNISSDYILFGNGASDLIFKAIYSLKPKNALLLAPTFSEYENALNCIDCNINYYNLKEEFNFCIKEDILNYIDESMDIIFITNPNNPTGISTQNTLIKKIADKCLSTNTILVIDECFIEFVENSNLYSSISLLSDNPNIIILNAFTKIYAIPGLRLGYMLSSNYNILSNISNSGQPWSVSTLAISSGIACMKLDGFIQQTVTLINKNRTLLEFALRDFGFTVFSSQCNFILFKTSIPDLKEKLLDKGILIRSCDNYKTLDKHFYRVAVKSKSDIQILVESIRNVL